MGLGPFAAGALDPQGPVAEAIADLWWLMLGLGVAVFVAFALLLVLGLFRRSSSETETGDQSQKRFGRWIIGAGVVVPSIILVVVFVATIGALRAIPNSAPPDALLVEIVGHQFWWEVRYPEEGVTVRDELHIPVGRPIALEMTSADVIHSFWVPALGGKMDLLPDGRNTLILQADQPGEHLSQCAEFCGLEHANMRLMVVAEPEEQFAAWLAEQERSSE